MSKELKYDAFISYRHNDLDKFVATNLHRLLETYKLPKSIIKTNNLEKAKIERVFRDQEELPLANSLEDPIIQALQNSEYLIVICSPRLKESIWCKKEIETFIKLHGRSHVLAVLVEGEPADSFPKELLYDEKTKKAVEPLALDCRGASKKEVLANLKKELLRLIAPMFNLNYDDLKRRHHERKVKNMIRIFGALTGVLLFFLVYASANLIIIKNKQSTILNLWSLKLAEEANADLSNDNRMSAITKSYQALTKYDGMKMPKTSEAIDSLTSALGVYDLGITNRAVDQINTLGIANYMKVNDNGDKVLITDTSSTITLYDLKNNKVLKKYDDLYNYVSNKFYFDFIGDKYIAYYANDNNMIIRDFKGKKVKTFKGVSYVNSSDKYLVVYSGTSLEVYDFDFKKVYDHKLDHDHLYNTTTAITDDYLIFTFKVSTLSGKEATEEVVNIIDLNTLKAKEMKFDSLLGDQYIIYKDDLYLLNNTFNTGSDSMNIYKINLKSMDTIWSKKYNNNFSNLIALSDNHNALYVAAGSSGYVLDTKDGSQIRNYAVGASTLKVLVFLNSDNFLVFTSDGNYYACGSKYKDAIQNADLFDLNVTEYASYEYTDNGFLAIPSNDNRVIIYDKINNKMDALDKFEYKLVVIKDTDVTKNIAKYPSNKKDLATSYVEVKAKNIMIFTYKDNTLEVYDTKTKKLLNTVKNATKVTRLVGIDNNDNIYLTNDIEGLVLNKDYEKIATIDNLVGLDKKHNQVILKKTDKYYKIKIYSTKDLIKAAEKYVK